MRNPPRSEAQADVPVLSPAPAGGHARLLIRDSSVYLLGHLLQKAAAFILIPLYTNYLSTSDYGLLELANTAVSLLLVAAALGVPNSINKCYHLDCSNDEARSRLLGTAVLFTTALSGTLALLGWVFERSLAPLLFSGSEGLTVYRFTLVWMVLGQLAIIPLELLRASGRSRLYLTLSLSQLGVQFGLILTLVKAGYGLWGVLTGTLAGLAAVILASGLLLTRGARWGIDGNLLSRMTAYGLAMIPVFLSGWVINLSDRFFLQSLAGLSVLGIYSLGYKFGTLVDILLVMPFQRAWSPLFLGMAGDEAAPRRLARVTTYLCAGLTFFTVAISLSVPPFLHLSAGPDFQAASGVVPLICLAYLIGGMASCLGNGLVVSGRISRLAIFAAVAAGANLVLNALLIPHFGMYGAAMATILSLGLQFLGIVLSLSVHYPVPIEWGRLVGLGAAGFIPLSASLALPALPLALDLIARIGLLALCPLLILLFRLPRPDEIDRIRALARQFRLG